MVLDGVRYQAVLGASPETLADVAQRLAAAINAGELHEATYVAGDQFLIVTAVDNRPFAVEVQRLVSASDGRRQRGRGERFGQIGRASCRERV